MGSLITFYGQLSCKRGGSSRFMCLLISVVESNRLPIEIFHGIAGVNWSLRKINDL